MPLRLRSLQARMLALSAGATLIALLLAGWAVTGVLARFVTEGLDRRLDGEVAVLASAVDRDGHVDRALLSERRGALEAGPGWRWRIAGPEGVVGSADFPPLDPGPVGPHAPPPPPPDRAPPWAAPPRADRPHPRDGRDGAHARQLTIATRRGPVTLTVAAPRAIVRRPIRGAVAPLLAALAAIATLLGAAALVQLRIGLRPVRRLRDEVAAIRAGTLERVGEDQPSELRPLAVELNALAAEQAAALAAARAAAANLAHALKTPVATLALDLRDEPARAAQVARIGETIRHHLARARAQAIDRRRAADLAPTVAGLIETVRRLHAERALAFATEGLEGLRVRLDQHDLEELLGNLLDNAARHAAGQVRVSAARDPADARRIAIAIEDDGPGIPAAERARVAQPGVRLDERGDGHGFGLAIARELATLYGGTFALAEAAGGGLLVRITLPAALSQSTTAGDRA